MKKTEETYASRLIWQESSPAPYESGWSIFAKLIGLNAISPKRIAQLISKPECEKIWNSKLYYRNGKWIDFDRFGQILNIHPDRLKTGFLDTWGEVQTDYNVYAGQKRCAACLSKGYHNVFFELGFIDICPWHETTLKSCQFCLSTIHGRGLTVEQDKNNSNWLIRTSKCMHITVYDKYISRLNTLDDDELNDVTKRSELFSEWWERVQDQPEIFQFLSKTVFTDKELEFLDFFLNAAEQVAGPCPWPLSHKRYSLRTLVWHKNNQVCANYDRDNNSASRNSVWGTNYRSVRKHLYRRYIKHHKDCWHCLINTHPYDLAYMDGETACYLCLAFAMWRLINENLLVLEGFKNPKIRTFYIKLFELPEEDFVQSNRAHLNLLYAQFFLIWYLIILKSTTRKIAINFGNTNYKDYLPFISHESICTLLIPSPNYLLEKSINHCNLRRKKQLSMFDTHYRDEWFESLSYHSMNSNKIIFKLNTPLRRGQLYYLNL